MAAVLFIDLDRFKSSTTRWATTSGDQLLQAVARAAARVPAREPTPSRGSAATSSSCCSRTWRTRRTVARVGQKMLDRSRAPYRDRRPASFTSPAASASHSIPTTAHDPADAAEERRHRDVPRQGAGQQQLPVLLRADEPAFVERLALETSLRARARARRVRAALPAEVDLRSGAHHRRRGADALAASGTRHGAAGASSSRSPRRPA